MSRLSSKSRGRDHDIGVVIDDPLVGKGRLVMLVKGFLGWKKVTVVVDVGSVVALRLQTTSMLVTRSMFVAGAVTSPIVALADVTTTASVVLLIERMLQTHDRCCIGRMQWLP